MKGEIQTTHESCPDCGKPTDAIKLGAEPAREICGRRGCNWNGKTLEEA